MFLGYALVSRAFHVFNKRTLSIEETVRVLFDDTNPRMQESEDGEDEIESSKLANITSEVSPGNII